MAKRIKLPGRVESAEVGGIVTGANAIMDDAKGKVQSQINSETDEELLRLQNEKQDNITVDGAPTEGSNNPVASGGVYTAEKALSDAIEAILLLIPSAASELNKLADREFVASSIATSTATFKGTFNLVSDLHLSVDATHEEIAQALDALGLDADANDYCFVQVPESDTSEDIKVTQRYKFNGTTWAYEYDLNNSGFTAEQWAAINSNITAALTAKLIGLPTSEVLAGLLAGKQDVLTFDEEPTAGSNNPVTSGGVYQANNDIIALINALDQAKQDVLTFDQSPVQGSSNPVTSGGVYDAIYLVQTVLATLGGNVETLQYSVSLLTEQVGILNTLYQALTQSDIIVGALPGNGVANRVYRVPGTSTYSDWMWYDGAWVKLAEYTTLDGYEYKGIAVPMGGPTGSAVKMFYIAIEPGTYLNFGNLVVERGINILKYDGANWSKDMVIGIDAVPTKNSQNLVNSGAVYSTVEKLNYQKLDKKVGKNLFDKTKRKVGYYIEGNKTESAAPNYSITDYISVTEGDSIIANKSANYTYNLFYDKNFAPLGNVIASTTSPMTVPVGAEYIRLSLKNADADTFQVEIGTQSTEYEPYTDDAPLTNTEKRLTSVERQVSDIQDELEDIVTSDFILSRTIAVSEWESGWLYIQNNALNNSQYNKHFGKIAVKAGDKIKVTSTGYYDDGVNCCLAAFFDNTTDPSDWSDATGFIDYYSDTADTSKKEREIIVPDGVSYVVLSNFGGEPNLGESYIYSLVSTLNIPDESISEDKLNSELRANIGHPKYNTITCKPTGTSGVDADFCGITAIADAINSITDATKNNRYKIHIRGLWHFTDPQDLTMYDGVEYSAIYMKKYVDIEGDGADNSIIFVDFPANANFHSGKSYSDYQPIYHNVESKVSGVKIVGKNCRYAYHIDSKDYQADGDTITIENCTIEYLGHPDYSGSFGNTFGTGIKSGQKWFIKDCNIISRSNNSAFAMHVPLSVPKESQQVNLINCNIDGTVTLHNYQTENMVFVNMIGCNLNNPAKAQINYGFYNGISASKKADYITAEINANDIECVYRNGGGVNSPKGLTLLFKSITTGITSTVRFDVTSSAFNLILGNSAEDAKLTTKYGWDEQYGYIYRDGGVDLAGQAFGTLDIDSNAAHGHTLGNRLGNCSVNNKVLKVIVDGNENTVTFNADYTSMTNAQVVEVINNALDGVATVELFSPAILYYPNVNGLKTVVSIDSGAILKGMGVIFESNGATGGLDVFGMRRAKNSDGYIDGICLDDTSLGQFGRVITKGEIYAKVMEGSALGDNRQYFTALDNVTSNWAAVGTKAGISLTEDGKFEKDVTPTLLRIIQRGLLVWKII